MPDADVLYFRVFRKYRTVYKQLCEDYLSIETVAENIATALRTTLKKDANDAIRLLLDMVESITDGQATLNDIEVSKVGYRIDQMARRSMANHRYVTIAVNVLKAHLMKEEFGHNRSISSVAVLREFVVVVYEADFSKCSPPVHHHNDISAEEYERRIKLVQPHVDGEITHIAEQIDRLGSSERLRKRPMKRVAERDFSQWDIAMLGSLNAGDN